MSLKLPSDFAKKIAETFNWKVTTVEDTFDFSEDKEGFFWAKLKPKKFLDKPDFRTLCALTRDLGGEGYLQGARAWKIPGPFAKKAVTPPQGSTLPAAIKPTEQGSALPVRIRIGYYESFPISSILSPSFMLRLNIADNIEELAEQIGTTTAGGEKCVILEPLVCRPTNKLGYVEVAAGERRLLAAKRLGLGVIPIVVKNLSDEEFDRVRMMENLARKDMSDYEVARALKYLMDTYPQVYPTQANLANIFNKSREWVTHHLQMLEPNLANIVSRDTLESGKVTERQAREILAAPGDKQQEIINEINKTGEIPSAREIHNIVHPEEAKPVKPQDMTVGKARELLESPAGKEVLEEAIKESQGQPVEEDENEALYADGMKLEPEKASESVPKTHEAGKDSVPSPTAKPQLKSEELDTGFKWECPECQQIFGLIHVKRSDGKIDHRLEARY